MKTFILVLILLVCQLQPYAQCPAPVFLQTSQQTSTSLNIYWQPVNGATYYYLQWSHQVPVVWSTAYPTNSPYTIQNVLPDSTYYFRIGTFCNSSTSVSYTPIYSYHVPALTCNPPYFSVSPPGTNQAWINLGLLGAGESYMIDLKLSTDAGWTNVATGFTGTNYNLTPLIPSTTYHVQVRRVCSMPVYSLSTIDTFTTASAPLCPKPSLSSQVPVVADTLLIFNWSPVTGAMNYSSSYKRHSDAVWTSLVTATTASRTLTNLQRGTFYDFIVKTNCTTGNSSQYDTLMLATLCPAPASASIPSSSITDTSATVNWASVPGTSGYYVEYKKSSDPGWTIDSTVALTYSMHGLLPATSYTVHIRTKCNSYAGSAFIQRVFSTACPKPTSVSAISSHTQATINWTLVPGAVSYRIEYKESGGSWLFPTVVTTSNNSLLLTGLNNATNYEVRVYTNCTSSLSSTTYATVQFTTQCQVPSGIYASAITNVQTTLNWNAVYGAGSYTLQYRVTGSGNSGWQSPVSNIAGTSYVLSGLSANTSYDYKVKTSCTGSGSGSQGNYSAIYSFVTLSACPVPNGLAATPYATQATVRWSRIPGVPNYRIDHRLHTIAGTGSWTTDSYSVTDTFFNLISLTNSTTYDFRVRANCSGSSSGNYDTAQFITAPPCPFPANLTYAALTDTSVTINWFLANGAQSYQLQYKKSSQSWSSSAVVNVNAILSDTCHLSGLLPCTGYTVRVRTHCSGSDTSAYTNDIFFTTLSQPGTSKTNPIIIPAPLPCGANAFISTRINSNANCFIDNLNVFNNVSNSPDIWYKFTLSAPDSVVISHCGSGLSNTFVHLLDSAEVQIVYNDNNGTPSCGLSNQASLTTYLAAGTYYVVSEGGGAFNNIGSITTTIKRKSCYSVTGVSQLDLGLFIEGYYIGSQSMTPVLMNQGVAQAAPNDVDDILVELRDPNTPSVVVASDSTRLHTDGTASCLFSPLSGNYYIVVKHRNAVETWSKNPVFIGLSAVQYDFYMAATQAYSDNLKEVEPGVWAIFSGDIDLNENVDLLDFSIMEADVNNFMSGYLVTDLNGDGNTDLLDSPVMENNINQFIFSAHP